MEKQLKWLQTEHHLNFCNRETLPTSFRKSANHKNNWKISMFFFFCKYFSNNTKFLLNVHAYEDTNNKNNKK
jgi:hypothetical protein